MEKNSDFFLSHYFGESPKVAKDFITYPARVWYQKTYEQLSDTIQNPTECQSITTLLLADFLGYNATHHVTDKPLGMPFQDIEWFHHAIEKLRKHYPIQYVLGYADFAEHRFYVNQDVLIPRPETAEMVTHITKKCPIKAHKILDIGTGSGCIAITLAKAFPEAAITALDIASSALEVASHNAKKIGVKIDCWQHDILNDSLPKDAVWDLIVSNPPYIPLEEQELMESRVIDHEPHNALFVPSKQPLLFYKKIIAIAHQHLATNGWLYLEVHEKYAEDVRSLLVKQHIFNITLHKDIHGKKRWIEAQKH